MMNTSLNNAIQRVGNGTLSKRFQQIRKTTPRPRRRRERRRKSKQRSMDLMKATMFSSEFVPRTRVDSVKQVKRLTFTKFVRRR